MHNEQYEIVRYNLDLIKIQQIMTKSGKPINPDDDRLTALFCLLIRKNNLAAL